MPPVHGYSLCALGPEPECDGVLGNGIHVCLVRFPGLFGESHVCEALLGVRPTQALELRVGGARSFY